jgi:ABC-type branched-subunit amino acid transport system ATPase component
MPTDPEIVRTEQLGQRPDPASVTNSHAALIVRDLAKAYGGNQAVDGVSFQVAQGSLVGLIGPNGAGKSTLGGLICGSIRSDSGEGWLADVRIDTFATWKRARLGLARTFQLSSEFQRLTVLENLLVGSALRQQAMLWKAIAARRRWQSQEAELIGRARQLLEEFELAGHEKAYAGELSGGQRRLVEIARALMSDPSVLVLDEPMAGLSPHMVERVTAHLERLRSLGFALLLIEHNVAVVSALSDRIVVMSQGRVIAEGVSEEVLGNDEVQAIYVAG